MVDRRDPTSACDRDPDEDAIGSAAASDLGSVDADGAELAQIDALTALPRHELLRAAWGERDYEFSVARVALASASGTWRHLERLTRLMAVEQVLEMCDSPARLEDIAETVRFCARNTNLYFSSDLVKATLADLARPDLAAFDTARLRNTADEMELLSRPAASGAAVYAYLNVCRTDEIDESFIGVMRRIYTDLKPRTRAMVLVAVDNRLTEDEREEQSLLAHSQLAEIFGGTTENITKTVSKAKALIKRKLAAALREAGHE